MQKVSVHLVEFEVEKGCLGHSRWPSGLFSVGGPRRYRVLYWTICSLWNAANYWRIYLLPTTQERCTCRKSASDACMQLNQKVRASWKKNVAVEPSMASEIWVFCINIYVNAFAWLWIASGRRQISSKSTEFKKTLREKVKEGENSINFFLPINKTMMILFGQYNILVWLLKTSFYRQIVSQPLIRWVRSPGLSPLTSLTTCFLGSHLTLPILSATFLK